MTFQQITPAAAFIGSTVFLAFGIGLLIRENRRYRGWVNGKPTAREQEWLAHGHARDAEAEWARGWDSGVVEADELMDAFITDQHCAELDEWFGPTPVLPDTPAVVEKLAALR